MQSSEEKYSKNRRNRKLFTKNLILRHRKLFFILQSTLPPNPIFTNCGKNFSYPLWNPEMLSYNFNENFQSSFNRLAALWKTWNLSGETEYYYQSLKFQAFSTHRLHAWLVIFPNKRGVKEALHCDEAEREREIQISFIFLVCAM